MSTKFNTFYLLFSICIVVFILFFIISVLYYVVFESKMLPALLTTAVFSAILFHIAAIHSV